MLKLIFGNGKVPAVIKDKDTIVLSRQECDITVLSDVVAAIEKHNPTVVINCAAKTNLENCAVEKHTSFLVNTVGVSNILEVCSAKKIKFVHISSGCLFDGNKVLSTESTPPDPKVWYTWTKTWADQYIINYGYEDYLILRPRQLISAKPHKSNMITKFLSFDNIGAIDEENSLTCIEDFKVWINHLIKIDATGIFNCSNDGVVTPYEIAAAIKSSLKPSMKVEKIDYDDFLKTIENKRVNTILCNEKLKSTGIQPRTAKEALYWCLRNYGDKS
tara:strand:+ start:921 stop:1742 length:822 start_codon:yes stop_codon:yes gene_type:complete